MDNVTVEIARNAAGVTEAYVIIDGRRSVNLLSSVSFISIDDARLKVRQKLRDCEITWTGLQPPVGDARLLEWERETIAMQIRDLTATIAEQKNQLQYYQELLARQEGRIRDLVKALHDQS